MDSSNLAENKIFDNTFLDKEHNLHLSLQVNKSLLKAAWFDIPSKTYIGFQEIVIDSDFSWSAIYNHLFLPKKVYQSLSLTTVNNNYTLVPKGIFDAQSIDSYLQFNLGFVEGISAFDTIDSIGAQIVYKENNKLIQEIKTSLPEIRISHFGKSLLEAFSQENSEAKTELFLHIQQSRFDLACYKNKKLTFFNSFDFKTAEDFIYFLLYAMEQLKLDRESCPISLCGEIAEKSSIYELTFKYIRNINILNRPKSARYSAILSQIPKSFHYSLFNQYLCE